MVRELDQLLAERSEEEFKVKFTILAPRANLTDLKLKKIRLKQVGWLGGYFWEQFELPIFSAGSPLVNFGNICPLLKRNQFLTIHDMTVFRTPENFSLSFRMFYKIFFRLLKFKEVKLITISEFSREEIKKILSPKHEPKVIYLGSDHLDRVSADNSIIEKANVKSGKYFLLVGSFSKNKNIDFAIKAFLQEKIKDFDLLIVCKSNYSVFQGNNEITERDNIKWVSDINDSQLKALYINAKSLIFPSLYEGFGLPPVEAIALGCDVLISDISIHREICGDRASYFNPNNLTSLINAIRISAETSIDQAGKAKRALQIRNAFSWEKAASQYLQVINGS